MKTHGKIFLRIKPLLWAALLFSALGFAAGCGPSMDIKDVTLKGSTEVPAGAYVTYHYSIEADYSGCSFICDDSPEPDFTVRVDLAQKPEGSVALVEKGYQSFDFKPDLPGLYQLHIQVDGSIEGGNNEVATDSHDSSFDIQVKAVDESIPRLEVDQTYPSLLEISENLSSQAFRYAPAEFKDVTLEGFEAPLNMSFKFERNSGDVITYLMVIDGKEYRLPFYNMQVSTVLADVDHNGESEIYVLISNSHLVRYARLKRVEGK